MTTGSERAEMLAEIISNPSYRLAEEDLALLDEDDLRPLRLQLELIKAERAMRRHGIGSTVVVFGSARIRQDFGDPNSDCCQRQAGYLEEARRFAALVSQRFQKEQRQDFVVVTGGGPGIMEAANRGAWEVGARSIGLNITLPHEQEPNPFITPDLAFRFRYFAIRKMHFALRAKAMVAFPGGFGTLDELFEILTLVQTGKMPAIPIVLLGAAFWRQAINFDFLIEEGMISPADKALFTLVETAEEAVTALQEFYHGRPPE
ncbi:TIGR00730 family protein (plasmid) [Hoeflea sp. IMCC20628]|uniref:LOG family protein n=1 Tax=Hoeflea sp. IMCC20628 TaxID=1620421 RepID=UPI00063AA80D|nr:TIGR00730 family Rossman fold protein [Hoeflea sp. IMCC20628]AKI03303.1 TIGR00730 family protein [Hoeflea sp. IMCC20628]